MNPLASRSPTRRTALAALALAATLPATGNAYAVRGGAPAYADCVDPLTFEAAGTTNSDAVIDSMVGVSVPNLSGGYSAMLPNHHITKPVLIGEIQADGQFETVWKTPDLVAGDAWTDYLPESKVLEAD